MADLSASLGGPFLQGFLLMASVIFAVGPQNAMLIRQGLRRERVFLVALIFTVCDALMIALGVLGLGQLIAQVAWLRAVVVYGGAAFLFWFAGKAFLAAWRGGQDLAHANVKPRGTLVATALALSLLNPGAILDTVGIIGAVSSHYPLRAACAFGLGAQLFSTLFFFTLAACTHRLAPALNNPAVWRGIDVGVGLITLGIGVHLLLFAF